MKLFDNCAFFAGLDAEGSAKMAALARPFRFQAGATIFSEGDPCPGVYVVERGRVRVFKMNVAGKEHVLHLVGPGETFAEVAAIGGFPCPASAEALEATEGILLPREPFVRALRESPTLALQMLGGMATWVRMLVDRIEDLSLRDATSRVARYLMGVSKGRQGRVELPTLKRHLASHLNLTSETLSRSLARLEERGVIENDATGVEVRDVARLEDVASV